MEIIGRDAELGSLHSFLDEATDGPAALVLEGDAGIGKSMLWAACLEEARVRGFQVLAARPAEAEQSLANVGLSDLFENVLDDVLPELPAPRRRALEVALLRESGEPVDRRALAVAVRGVLERVAERGPVLVAVDDSHWLDASSSSALAFALRRLTASRVRVLLARRVRHGDPPGLEHGLDSESVGRLRIGVLSVGALHRILRDRFGRPFARQTLLRIHETSGGNPFFALELAGALGEVTDPLRPLTVPATLDELVHARLSRLPAVTRDALAIASAIGTPSRTLLERAGVEASTLDAAVAADVIKVENGRIHFSHPLLASALYRDLGERKWSVHRQIAELADDPLLRARHRALATELPDAEVAALLDDAAGLAAGRGAAAVAAELAEQAHRLTPPDRRGERHRRALAAARAHQTAGEWPRARVLATDLLAEPDLGSLRGEALIVLADLETLDRAAALLDEALLEASSRPALQSVIQARLAWAKRFRPGFDHARLAIELAEQVDDDDLRARARMVQVVLDWFAGSGRSPDDLPARAKEFATAVGGEQLVQEATLAVANTLAPSDRREEARGFFEREHREWRDRDEPRAARALWGLAWVEFWAGRWELAATFAEQSYDISIQYGLEVPQDHLPIALIAVHRGRLDQAREHSERALTLAEKQFALHPPQHLAILGLAALLDGDRSAAKTWFGQADRQALEFGWGEPSVRWWTGDHIELLLEDGQTADAEYVLGAWEADALRVGRDWVLANVVRCRGLVAAARGEIGPAEALLQLAVAQHDSLGDPFGSARARLALGVLRRRARQKRAARDEITAALIAFEELGAAPWSTKARAELGTIGGRSREEGLTPAELRVAMLVADGHTNREVAATLFLGERTVASHLTHIYAKLGVRSRTELSRRLR